MFYSLKINPVEILPVWAVIKADAFPVSTHLLASFARLPLHGLVYHELHSRVEYEDEGGECAVPQGSHTLSGYDLREGI